MYRLYLNVKEDEWNNAVADVENDGFFAKTIILDDKQVKKIIGKKEENLNYLVDVRIFEDGDNNLIMEIEVIGVEDNTEVPISMKTQKYFLDNLDIIGKEFKVDCHNGNEFVVVPLIEKDVDE